jgi:hypothetical protein
MALVGTSDDPDVPGVFGENTGNGEGIRGTSHSARGGVVGINLNQADNAGLAPDGESAAVFGESVKGEGVRGVSHGLFSGVVGVNDSAAAEQPGGLGVTGEHKGADFGVKAVSKDGVGLAAFSTSNEAVHAETMSPGTAAIAAYNLNPVGTGAAIFAKNVNNEAVHAETMSPGTAAIAAYNLNPVGTGAAIFAKNVNNEAVHAETMSPGTAAIAAYNLNPEGTGAAIFAKKIGTKGLAGFFDGNVFVTGDIVLANADCAEDFDIAEVDFIEPGTVMVVGEEGALHQSYQAYDKRVTGVISGAGGYKPGIVLDKQQSQNNRKPIALLGKVFCKVDAQFGAVEAGDLLTTSPTPGHAMKASDPLKSFGTVIGKALRPLKEGKGMIQILVALQ